MWWILVYIWKLTIHNASSTESLYRHIDVFTLGSDTTNIQGDYDSHKDSFAPDGKLKKGITPAQVRSFLDFNVNSELAKFGLLNGGDDNNAPGLLNEKWEGLTMVPVDGQEGEDGQWFVIATSDNDFITQHG